MRERGPGVLQDRFKKAGKGPLLLFFTPVRAEAGGSLENTGHWGGRGSFWVEPG